MTNQHCELAGCGCDVHDNGKCGEDHIQPAEWSGRCCDIAPATCWVDDETSEHINAITGKRTHDHDHGTDGR